ncbi:MAG: efflux RND transporter periplasmic adaptor subunit, partial [Candidatus Eremiobacteraeota bacterium]|nr:efflux RND transporter periplasmic adaptor subunit [Candidatus Eremiobacteraeota bacterium]
MLRTIAGAQFLKKAFIAGLLLSGIASCGAGRSRQPTAAAPYVQTTLASYGSVRPTNTLAGVIAPYQNVAIQSSLTEPADSVNVQEGDRVYRGQVLAQLDIADLQAQLQQDLATAASDRASTSHNVYQGNLNIAQAQDTLRSAESAVHQAQATLERDQTDLRRYQQLYANGYVSQQQLTAQATTVRNDEQAVRSAQASLAGAASAVNANGTSLAQSGLASSSVEQSRATEQVALAQAQQVRVQIAKATIISPIEGVVVNRNINPGEYPGTRQIFTLQQVNPVYAVLRGSSAQVAQISAGAPATIVTSDARRQRAAGRVAGVLNEIAPGSTDFQVKVLLQNPDGRLRPGAVVEGTIAAPQVN